MSKRVQYTLNVRGRLFDLSEPQVMGILNVTPDSFYAGSRMETEEAVRGRVQQIVDEGGSMIDIGAYSSRPGAADVTAEEEMARLRRGMKVVREEAPEIPVSVDTFRADVAKMAVEELGVDIINDIPGDDAATLTFKVSDGNEVAPLNASLRYETDAIYGTPAHPFGIDLDGTTGLGDDILENGAGADQPSVYDLQGRKLNPQRLRLNKGVYIVNGTKQSVQ